MEDKMYLTAGELADMLGISKQTVLYYDRIGLFAPAGRDEKGYRYYTVPQVDELDTVLSFRNMGVPLEELRDYLREKSPQRCLCLLSEHLERIDAELERLSAIRKKVSGKIAQIQSALAITDLDRVQFEEREAVSYLYEPCDTTDQRRFMICFLSLCEQMKRYQIDFYNPICRILEPRDLLAKNFSQVAFLGAPVQNPRAGEKLLYRPGGTYACTYQRGNYGDTAETYRRLLEEIDKRGYEVCGRAYESDVLSILTNPDGDYTTHIAVQVKKSG